MCFHHKWVTYQVQDIAFLTKFRMCPVCGKRQIEVYGFEGDIEWEDTKYTYTNLVTSLLDCKYKKCSECDLRFYCWTIKHENGALAEWT